MASQFGIGAEPLDSVEVAVVSDVGAIRTSNEDSVLAVAFGAADAHPWGLSAVLLVADGVGGHDAGEVASGIARSRIEEAFARPSEDAPLTLSEDDLWRRIDSVIEQINAEICAYSPETTSRPATTLTLCLVREGRYYVGHVGDTRAYVVRGEVIEQITIDDTWVAEAIRSGAMTPEEADRSPFRNHLMKAVGIKPIIVASHYSGDWDRNDILVICSDGLSDYVQQQEIWHELRHTQSMDEACKELVQRAIERGGHDNISVVASARTDRQRRDPSIPAPQAFQRPGKQVADAVVAGSGVNAEIKMSGNTLRDTSIGELSIPAGFFSGEGGGSSQSRMPAKPAPPTLPEIALPPAAKPVPPTSPGIARPPMSQTIETAQNQGEQHAANSGEKRMSWRAPVIVLVVVALVIAVAYVRHISGHKATSAPGLNTTR